MPIYLLQREINFSPLPERRRRLSNRGARSARNNDIAKYLVKVDTWDAELPEEQADAVAHYNHKRGSNAAITATIIETANILLQAHAHLDMPRWAHANTSH